jgi:PX domain
MPDVVVGRRYGQFVRLHKQLRTELPGKILPSLPRKNKSSTTSFLGGGGGDDDDSISSGSTTNTTGDPASMRNLLKTGHRRQASRSTISLSQGSERPSGELEGQTVQLYREEQRVSLRAFLRTLLSNPNIAKTKSIQEFLTSNPVKLNEEELDDEVRRKEMDELRLEEQRRFYEIARQRARDLDVYMERFRRDIVERSTSPIRI